jgi:hypothetical protein
VTTSHKPTEPDAWEREFRRIVKPLEQPERAYSREILFIDGVRAQAERELSGVMRHLTERDVHAYVAGGKFEAAARRELPPRVSPADVYVWRAAAERPGLGYSVFYRACWLFIGLVALVWGVIVGSAVAGSGLVGPTTAVAGCVSVVGLMVTLLVAGRRSQR